MWVILNSLLISTNTINNVLLFNISRSLLSSGVRCTPMRRQAARPAVCPSQGSTWGETPPCSSVTCCWPTLGNTTVKSRLGGSITGARSTSLCWVSVVIHTQVHERMHIHAQYAIEVMKRAIFTLKMHICAHTHTHRHRPNHWIISLAHFLRHADWSNDSIWFRQCDLILLMLFGFVWIGFLMRWDQKHATGSGEAQNWLIKLESELHGQASSSILFTVCL